jgi:hypothetical protein
VNAVDVLKYGHRTALRSLEGIPESEWEENGVCGWWSVKNIIAHLASYELVLVDILKTFSGEDAAPALQLYSDPAFNDKQVDLRKDKTPSETLAEFNAAHAEVMSLIAQIPVDERRRVGSIPWYGEEYDLEDLIAYMYYGHKREHSAQINAFKDTLK